MATFADTQNMAKQEHFEVLEIDLPVINGVCTQGESNGYGTPLTCDQVWAGEYKTYKFTNENAPILAGSPWRCIKKISETSTQLKPSEGLSARGSLKVTFADFPNADPNTETAGVTDAVIKQGTFFGKLSARQIFENKAVRLKLYRVEPDGTIDLVNGAQTRHYVTSSLTSDKNGLWSLSCKDVLSLANLGEKTFPIATQAHLRQDIDNAVVVIPVDESTDYSNTWVVRIGDEFLHVESVMGNLTSNATLNVKARGTSIVAPVSGVLLSTTEADDHKGGDEVFLCEISDNETIDSLLTRVLVSSDFDPSLIPAQEWSDEVNEWHSNDKINTIHSESKEVNSVLTEILTGFLMDMWFSTTENKAKLSAISVWKQSSTSLVEGKEINAHSISKKAQESLRASRALVIHDKRNLADSEDVTSYKKGSQFSDNTLISDALYKEHKDKIFEPNRLIDTDSASLLVQRYVSRFKFTPFVRDFITEERYLNFNIGDVVDIASSIDQAPSGLISSNVRAQILKINPTYGKQGRNYKVSAMTYEASFEDNSEIVLDGALSDANLYVLAGAPSEAITITFVLTNYSYGDVAIKAGQFATGSKVILILSNGFDGQASGGNGGNGQWVEYNIVEGGVSTPFPPANGTGGGTVYDAQGVDTDIYFSGATPSTAYPTADGYIRAPSGGGGGFDAIINQGTPYFSGDGGNGGDGRTGGIGGEAGVAIGLNTTQGSAGRNGAIDGSSFGGGWGKAGDNNDATGGQAGAGVVDSGATVTFYGADASRYINGTGSHP